MKRFTLFAASIVVAGIFGLVVVLNSTPSIPMPVQSIGATLAPGGPTDTLDLHVTWGPSVIAGDSITNYRIMLWTDGVIDSALANGVTTSMQYLDSTVGGLMWTHRARPAPPGSISEYRVGVQAVASNGQESEYSYFLLRRQGSGALVTPGTVQPEIHIPLPPSQWLADSFVVFLETYPDGGTVSTGKQLIFTMRSIADSVVILPPILKGDRHALFVLPYLNGVAATADTISVVQLNYSRQ